MKKKFLIALFVMLVACLLTFTVSAADEVTLVDGKKADIGTVFKINSNNQITGYNSGYSKDMITDVVFPDEIVGLEANFLFDGASNLNTLTFGATDTFFISGDNIFQKCSVKTVTFNPNCVVEFRKGSFSSCTSLTKITFPKFSMISGGAFQNCSNMVNTNELVLVEGLTKIGGHAFDGCLKLTGVVRFPASLETLNEYPFYNTGFDGFDFSKCVSLSSIGNGYGGAFANNDKITTLDLSNCTSLESLGKGFASNCDELVNVILPPNLTEILNLSFAHCYKLQSLVIPASVQTVGHEAFHSARKNQTVKTFTLYLQGAVKFNVKEVFRDSGAKIEFVLLGNSVTAEELIAANPNMDIIGNSGDSKPTLPNATLVNYLDPLNKWGYTPGGAISNHTIVENYCTTLGLTKSHSATDTICNNEDKCKDCAYVTCTPHESVTTISYANGYDAKGLKQTCSVKNCNGNIKTIMKPIFEATGYSVKEKGGYGIISTYQINTTELAEFEALNGALKFGIIMANANFDGYGEFMSKNSEGEYELNSAKGIQIEIKKGYSKINARIDQFTQNEVSLNLVMALYVVDANGVSYIQNDGTYAGEVTRGGVTLDVVTISKIAEITGVTLPFVIPTPTNEETL